MPETEGCNFPCKTGKVYAIMLDPKHFKPRYVITPTYQTALWLQATRESHITCAFPTFWDVNHCHVQEICLVEIQF